MCEGGEDLGEWLFGWIIALAKVVIGRVGRQSGSLMLGLSSIIEGWSLLTQIQTKYQKVYVPVSFNTGNSNLLKE